MDSAHRHWFTEHRRWEDYFSAALGFLIVISPVLVEGVDPAIIINAGFVGVFITMLGLLEVMWLQRWEEKLELILGLWMVASPYLWGYAGLLATTHYVLGGLVVAMALLEMWQDRNRRLDA